MVKPAKPTMIAIDFPGMTTNVDPIDLPSGAAEVQINLQSNQYGEMASRRGTRQVTFESE